MLHRVGSIGLFASVLTSIAGAQIGTVEHYQKISRTSGGFGGQIPTEGSRVLSPYWEI
jgi:hypothetical protein